MYMLVGTMIQSVTSKTICPRGEMDSLHERQRQVEGAMRVCRSHIRGSGIQLVGQGTSQTGEQS